MYIQNEKKGHSIPMPYWLANLSKITSQIDPKITLLRCFQYHKTAPLPEKRTKRTKIATNDFVFDKKRHNHFYKIFKRRLIKKIK